MRRRKRLVLISIALMGLAVVLAPDSRRAGPATSDEQSVTPVRAAATSVGRVQGTEAYIAVSYDGTRLRAYACNGSARRPATISAWFEAPWDGHEPIAIVNGDRAKLRVERVHADGRISGRLDGHRFTVAPASGPAGLRERDGTRWVVLADGSIRGTFIPQRPPKCRLVLVTTSSGTQQWVSVC